MSFADKVKGLLGKHGDKVDQAIDKAGDVVDRTTGGAYARQVDTAQEQAKKMADRAREGRGGTGDPGRPPR